MPNLKTLIMIVVLAMSSTAIFAQIEEQKVPEDTVLRKGTLDNGLTYYVRKCSKPEKKAELRLVVNVGSNQEKDNERGISHFVEHMMFKGTKHFTGQSAVDYLRHCGVAFGPEANAFTSNDYTTYVISDLPMTSEERLDSCLLIFRDWAGDALLKDADIESERNVIVEEWRSKELIPYLKDLQEDLFGGSQYTKLPIGDMDIIKGCKPKVIRNYYKHWYQPQNMAVIVTGDIDADTVISRIKSMFSDLKRGKNIPTNFPLPADVDTPQVHSYDAAKSTLFSICEVLVKLPVITSEELATVGGQQEKFFQNALLKSINNSIGLRLNYKETFFVSAQICSIPNARCTVLSLNATCKPENLKAACELLYKKLEDAKRNATEDCGYIYTKTRNRPCEYNNDSTKIDFAATRDSLNNFFRNNKDTLTSFTDSVDNDLKSKEWADRCTNAFLFDIPLLSNQASEIVDNHISRNLKPNLYKTKFAEYISGKNMYTCFYVSDGGKKPTEDEIKEIAERVHNMTDEELNATNGNEPEKLDKINADSIDINPVPGKIVKSFKNKDGYTELTLSNGIKTFLYSDKDAEKIALTLKRKGGSNLLGNKDMLYAGAISNAVQQYTVGGSSTCSVIRLTDEYYVFDATTSKDFESRVKAMYAALTSTKVDPAEFNKYVLALQKAEQALFNNPLSKQIVELSSLPYASAERRNFFTQADSLSIEHFQKVIDEYKSNYNGTAVVIRGKFDMDSIMPFVLKYVGGLPSKATPIHFIDRPEDHYKDKDETKVVYFENKTPIAKPFIFYTLEGYKYTQEMHAQCEVLNGILGQILFNRLRVQHSDVYTPEGAAVDNQYPVSNVLIQISFTCNPENRERIVEDVNSLMKEVAVGDIITQEMIDGYISLREKNIIESKDKNHSAANEYINIYLNDVIHMNQNNLYYIKKVTPESLKAYLKNILDNGHRFVGYLTTK